MMMNNQANENIKKLYLKRKSLFQVMNKRLNKDQDLGFDYRGKLFDRTSSPYFQKIDHVREFLPFVDKMISFLIDRAKEIKKTFAFAIDKYDRDLN